MAQKFCHRKINFKVLENSYESLINQNETLSEVPIFTEIYSEFIKKICSEAKYNEKYTFINKKIAFIKTHIDNLEEKKICLIEKMIKKWRKSYKNI